MIFVYHIPWDFAIWTHGYRAMMALQSLDKSTPKASPAAIEKQVSPSSPQSQRPFALFNFIKSRMLAAVHFLNPMLGAMMLGVIVGSLPFARQSLFDKGAVFSPLGDALKQVGSPGPVLGMQIL